MNVPGHGPALIDIYEQVHLIARHYHWSEEEILGLSNVDRKIYVELILEEQHRRAQAYFQSPEQQLVDLVERGEI